MASQEDRTKRLEAGKEKLAAFRNKKAKSKRKISDNALDQNMQQLQNLSSDHMFNVSEDNSPTETLSSTDSDEYSTTSEDECSQEGTNWSVSPHTQIRISELDGAMQEKQLALDNDFGDSLQWNNFSEVELALSQRDELLSQLTRSLQSSLGQPTLTEDFMTQVCSLAEHICTLQAQLHQADQDLQEQLILRESSMISLQAAKAQILQLQVIITHKDKEITSMTQLLQANNGAFDANRLKDEHISHIQQLLEQQTGQLLVYQTQLEAKEVELSILKEEWFTREQELITSLSAGSEELSSLKKSQDSWKLETHKLQEKCLHLQSALDEKESADIRLQELEHQLEELRNTHELDSKEIAALREKNQDHSECLSSHQSLHINYETVMKQHSDCLLQLEHFKELSSDLQEKLHSLCLVENELSVLKQRFDSLNVSYLNEVDKCSHLEHRLSELSTTSLAEQNSLKNTIDELGMEISKLQTALYSSRDLNGDNYFESHSGNLVVKEQDLSEFQANLNVNASLTEVDLLCHQVDEQKHTHEEGHFLDQCAQENIDEKIYLKRVIDDLSARLKEKESESHENMAKLTKLQNDVLSAQHVHGVELSEKDFYIGQIQEKLEELYSERDLLTATVKTLQLRLKQQSFERSSTESSLVEDRGAVWQAVVFGDNTENCGMEQGGAFIVEDKSPSCEVLESKNQIFPSHQGSLQPSEVDGEHLSEGGQLKEDFGYLSLQVKTLQMALNTATSELAITKESLDTVTAQLVTKASSDHLEEDQLEPTESYEDQAVSLKLVSLQLEEKEVAQLELQSQLETTVSQWQKLQLIVQEKEIEIQNLQENLDEQKRISSTIARAHQEEGDSLRSVIDSLKSQQESDCSQISNLENEIFSIMTERDIVKSKLLEFEATIAERDIELKSLKETIFNSSVEIDDLKSKISVTASALNESQTKLVAVEMEVCELRSNLSTRPSEMQSVVREQDRFQRSYSENFSRPAGYSEAQNGDAMDRISEKDQEINILKSLDAKNQTVINELSHSQAESNNLVSLLRNELSFKEKELDGHKLKLSELESTLCSVQSKLMELEGEGKEHKTKLDETEVESVSLKKKHSAQTLKLKASKKVIAQKEEKIAKMDSLLSEKEEEILNLFKNVTDKDEEIANLLKKVTDKEEKVSNLLRNVTEKDEEISNMLRIVTENDEEISKFLKIIAEKDEEITDLNRSISNMNYNTSDMSKTVAEKDEQIVRLNRELNEKNGEATAVLERLAKREEEINELTQNVTLKEEDIAGMSLVITEKVVEVTDLKERLSKKDAEFDNLWKIVAEKEETIADLSMKLTEKDAEMTNLVQDSDKWEGTFTELRKQLLLKEDEIERLHNTMEERENLECDLRKELSQKEKEVASWVGLVGEKEEALSVMSRDLIDGHEERANLCKSVAEKDDEILNLNKILIEKEKLLDENHLAFVKQGDKIAELQRNLKEKEEEISNLFVNTTDKDVIDELRTSFSHCDATIIELTQNLKVKDEEVNELQMNLSNRDAAIIELNKTLKLRDEEVGELQVNLSHELNKVNELTQHLTHKDEEIIELHTSLSQKSYEISNTLQNVSAKEDDIAGLLKNLKDKDMEITSLNQMLLEKDASISDLNRAATENVEKMAELDQKLTEAVKEIASMNQVLSEKEALLGDLNQKVSEKEVEVSALHDMLTHKVEEIATIRRKLSDKDDEFANICMAGAERDYQVTQSKMKLAEIEEELSQSQKNISMKEEQLNDLMKNLNEKDDSIFKMGQVITKQEQDLFDLQQQLNEKETYFETRYHAVTDEHLQSLQNKDVQLSELNRTLTEKDQEATKLLQKVQDKDIQIGEINFKLIEKDQEITELLQNVQDRDIQFTDVSRKLTEKDMEISELLQNAQDKDIQYIDLNRKLAEKDVEISELLQTVEDKDIQVGNLNRMLAEKDQDINDHIRNVQTKDVQLGQLNSKLSEKDLEIIKHLQASQDREINLTVLTEKDQEISQLLQNVQDKNIQYTEINRKLTEKDQEISKLLQNVEDKEIHFGELNIKLTEKDQEINELLQNVQHKDIQYTELNRKLTEIGQEISKLLQNVEDKDIQVGELNRNLIEKDQEISKLLQNVEDKDIQVGELNRNLTEKDQEISELLQNAQDKDIEYTDLNRKLTEKDQVISELLQNVEDKEHVFSKQITDMQIELVALQRNVSDHVEIVTELNRSITIKDEAIQNMKNNFSEKETEIVELKIKLSEKDEESARLLHVVNKKEDDLANSNSVSDDKAAKMEEEAAHLNRALLEKETEIFNIHRIVTEKSDELAELKLKFIEKEQELVSALQSCSDKEERLVNLMGQLMNKEEEISNISQVISEKEDQVARLNRLLTEKDTELANVSRNSLVLEEEQCAVANERDKMREMLLEKEAEIETKMLQLSEMEAGIKEMSEKLHEREAGLGALVQKLLVQESETKELTIKLSEKENDIDEIRTRLSREVTAINEELSVRLQDLVEINAKLSAKETEVNVLSSQLREKENNLSEIYETLSKKESVIGELNSNMTEKDAEIYKQNQILEEQDLDMRKMDQVISEREALIDQIQKKLTEQEGCIVDLNELLAGKETEISELKKQVTVNEAAILDNLLVEKEKEVNALRDEVSSKCQEIDALTMTLKDKALESTGMNNRITETEAQLSAIKIIVANKESDEDHYLGQLNSKERDMETLKHISLSLESEISLLTSRLTDSESLIIELTTRSETLASEVLNLHVQLREKEFELGRALQDKSLSDLQLVELTQQLEGLEKELREVSQARQLVNSSAFVEGQENIQAVNSATFQETHNKYIHGAKGSVGEGDSKHMDWNVERDNLLQSLEVMQQYSTEKDLEISELLVCLDQEKANSTRLLLDLTSTKRNNAALESWISYTLEKMEEKESVMLFQELQLEEHSAKIANFLNSGKESVSSAQQFGEAIPLNSNEALPLFNSQASKGVDMVDSHHVMQETDLVGKLGNKESGVCSVDMEKNYCLALSQLTLITEECQQKDGLLLKQSLQLEHYSQQIAELSSNLEHERLLLAETTAACSSVREENDNLTAQCQTLLEDHHHLKQQMSKLESETESHRLTSSQYLAECNNLSEQITELSNALAAKENVLAEVKTGADSCVKEMNDLKTDIEQKDAENSHLRQSVESLTTALDKSQEERELLKANFDSCMEDMQQRLGVQEMEIQTVRSQLAEQTKNVHLDKDQLKEIFEHQMTLLEEKLLQSEKLCEQALKELADTKAKYSSCTELYENQVSDLESNLHTANSELSKLKDQLSRVKNNHECEFAGLKRLHEIQTTELEDNCLALERNVSELKRQLNEQITKFNKERINFEQTLEFQVSDNEEKRRMYEIEISRLKRHLEEMKQDHELELKNLEKSCESRLYELEDKCCIATNELERLRKSFSADGDYSEERHRTDLRIEDLETTRRDLEIKNRALEEEVTQLREQVVLREEELRTLLLGAAEKQQEKHVEMSEEISSLKQSLSELSRKHAQALEEIVKRKDAEVTDLLQKNKQLELKSQTLEMYMEQDVVIRQERSEEKSNVADLQSQIASLSEENSSLKRRLLMQKAPERTLRLSSGVEAICPPYSHTSTEFDATQNVGDECFSPAVEDPVLEGFVAESQEKYKSPSKKPLATAYGNQEPDFVEEENDRFQPEMEHERVLDSPSQLNMHPIREEEIHECFQPEVSDLFLMDTSEEQGQRMMWSAELTVGMSPSHLQVHQQSFDFNTSDEIQLDSTKSTGKSNQSQPVSVENENKAVNDVTESRINQIKEDLEEEYVMRMRRQEVDLTCQFETQYEQYKNESEQHFAQRIQAVRYEWERKFTKALRKVKKEMERRNSKDLRYQRHDNVIRLNSEGADSASGGLNMPDIAERNEELDEVVEQLHKENQELAEVRDVLLRQIEISQTRGLHDRLQHELQSMLTTRDAGSFQSSTPTPTLVATLPTIEPEENTSYESPGQLTDEADGSRSEISESSSVREGFLEEFEEISHQSSQDLPLEWELTSTETGAFEQEPRSIWEVFDGRCVRQDCQEVDTLRIQYEHQLASLQRQLEAERRGNEEQMAQRQEEYTKALSDLRSHLDLEQQDTLDRIITALSHIHTEELKNLISTHQEELSLELAALKLSIEQIYLGKSQLEAAEQKQWHTQQMEALKKQHKDEINSVRAGNVTESEVNASLTDDYNRLVKRISQDLETSFYNDTNSNSVLESGSPTTSQELQNLLLSQQEEIISLRTKLLTDYQALLLSRSDLMTEQAAEVNKLEVQMQDIQQQYDSQLVSLQEKITSQSDLQEQESEEHHQKLEQDYNNLKAHYENLIQNIELEFEDKINSIKDKYEEQISSILLSGIGKNMAEAPTPNLVSSSTQHESQGVFHDVGTVVKSIDIHDGTDISEEGDLILQMKKLESDLLERDTEFHKLQNELANEELRSKSLETELSDIQQSVKDLQEEVDAAESRCHQLEELLKDKDAKINQLEEEKKESEKLYRDLQEKESSLSKITTNGHPSDHGDDSVETMRQGVSNTVRAGSSNLEELQSDSEDLRESQFFEGDFNSNNNNNYNNSNNNSCDQLTIEDDSEEIDNLKEQLEIIRKREQHLRNQMEEKEHAYEDMIEGLRQELEHEKQVELETIQSEFRIQLEVELRRQAAEIAARHSTNDNLFDQAGGQRMESDMPHDKVPSDLSQSAITETFSPSSSQKCSSSTLHSRSSSVQSDSDNQSQLEHMQTGTLDRAQVHMLDSDQVHSLDNTGSTTVKEPSESFSDPGKATPSTHSSPSHLTYVETDSVNSLENTDFKKQMEALQEEYEARLNELKSLLDEAEEERTSLTFKHQEEMEALRQQLNESEDRYDRLMEGVEMGEHPQLNEIFQDKYDRQLELTKSLMQKDFDDMLKEEKKSFVEKHRTLMKDLMGGREKEEDEMKEKFKTELEQLRQTLTDQFHEQQQRLQEEIDRLTMELDELRNHSRGSEGDQVDKKNLTLPELEEIMLSFQDENTSSASHDGSRDTSTPVKLGDDSDGAINMNESGEFSHHYGSGDLLVHRPDPDGSHVNSKTQYEDTEPNVSSSSHSEPLDSNVNAIERCEIQIRTFADVVKSPPPLSVNERQQLEYRIQQLMLQVERLTQQLAQFQAAGSMSPPQGSLQFATGTLKGDDTALVAMLQSDLDRISSERESVQRINDRLLSLLSDSVKTYVGVEDTINRRLTQVVSNRSISPTGGGASGHSRPSNGDSGPRGERQGRMNFPETDRNDRKGDADSSHDSQSIENTSFQSNGIDEGLEISQRLAESIFVGPDLDAEGEEILADARGRLQTSVVQLLELMERSTSQLVEAKKTQQELLDALAERAHEMEAMSSKCSDLQTQLAAETEAKDYLGLELHKAEGLISGYSSERDSLENQIQSLEQQREAMIVDLDLTRSRLEHFERSQSEMDTMREELTHQQQVLRDNPGQEIQVDEPQPLQAVGDGAPALLGEVAILNKDKRELANQFQQQVDLTRKRINELETQAEESERRHEAAIEEKAHELEDLRLQFENVERQLKASKAFVDEQIQEREQEREEHQKEIERLELMLDAKDRHSNAQQRLQIEITDLTEQLQARIASQSDMHQRTLDLQKALQDKELSAHDLKTWVSQLEKELDQRGSIEEQLKMRISRLERQLTDRTDDNAESTEEDCSASLELNERSPPMILSPVQTQRVSMISLEEELRRCQQVEQELEHENTALKEQVQVQLLQISGLRNQLDQLRHYSGMEADSDSSHLRIKLQDARDNLEKMEEKLSEAHNRIEVLENTLKLKRDEAELIRVKVTKILDMGSAQEENESLKSQLEELQSQMSHLSSISSLPSFPPELLEEKNHQIEELTEKIVLLEEELTQTQQEEAVHKDKIRQFQVRLKEKDEEIGDLQDNINSLRRGEPYLDVSLPMNEEANNLLNISMTGRMPRLDVDDLRTSIQQEFEDTILEREGELRAVKENLAQVTQLLEEKEQELQRLRENVTQLQLHKDKVNALEDSAEHKDSEIYQLTLGSEELRQQIQEHVEARELLEAELRDMEEQLSAAKENKNKCESELHEKEDKLDQMIIQIDSLQHEISSLTGFQNELQEDYDTVQSMLEEKEKEIESLTRELMDNKAHPEALETLLQLEDVVAALQKELLEKDNVVEEKEEELYELRDQLEEMGNVKEEMTKIKSQLEEKCKQAEQLRSDLEEALRKEREALKSTEEDQKEEADNNLVADTLSERDNTIAELTEKIVTLEQNLNEFSEKCQENARLGEKIESLDHELSEAKEQAASERGHLLQQIEEMREKYEKYIYDLEEEMKCQANDRSAEITKERYETTFEENQCLKLEVGEKQATVDLLQSKLESALADKEEMQEKVRMLECQAREVEELSVVKRQLEEAEEQLRLRQSVMLDIQLEKEKLLEDMAEMETLRKVVEEKDRSIEELESQLRFRQSCILDVEAGRESVVEEKEILETQLRRELTEKEDLIIELQELCVKLKGDGTKEMLQQDREMNGMMDIGTDVDELKQKLLEASDELVNLSTKYRTLEDRLTQSNCQLAEREDQIHQLQAEIQALQQENSRPHPVAVRVQELQRLVQDKEETAEAQAIRKRKAELAELRTTVYSELQNATRSPRALNLSASLPMDEVTAGYGGMTRWDSEPAGLALGSRDGTYLRLHMNEVEKLARQQQRELSQKNYELEQVRQNLERWLKMGGQNPMESIITEKQTVIISLQTELENWRSEINQKEVVISSLQHDIQDMVKSHSQDMADKDHQITQLQEEIYLLKPSNVMASTPKGQSLSPETKQSISQLKTQLRKAHSALEEMRVSHQMTGGFGAGDANSVQKSGLEQEVEKLKELLKAREDELAVLKSKSHLEQEQAVEKALEEQRQTLEDNHEKYISELILQHQEQVNTLREITQDTDSLDHGQNIESEVLLTQGQDDSMPQRLQALLERLNQLGEHFLSLPDLRYLKQHLAPVNQGSRSVDSGWDTERKALLATIDALKDLLKQVNIMSGQESEEYEDWRSGFLQAFVNIYIKEKDVVQAEVSDASISYPDLDIVTQLETKLQQLIEVHQRSLDDMMRADRQSLISEVSSLHQRLSEAKVQLQSNKDELIQQVTQLEEAKSKLEWKLQRQVQMLEYKLQQEAVIEDDLKKSLKSERQRVSELSSQSTQDRSHVLELQSELSSTQIQLSKAKDSLQREQQRFTSITDALEEEKAKSARLSELLDATRRKLKTLEEDMTEADRKQQLKSQSEDSYIMDLQSELRKERQKCVQFSEAEDQARRELHEMSDKLDAARRQLASQQMEHEANIEALHRDQMEREVKHRLEGETQTNARLRELLEAERDQHQAALEQERTIVGKQKHEIDILKSQHDQFRQQYENEKSRADNLKINLDRATSDQGANKTEPGGTVGGSHERNLRLHLKLVEEDREALRLKVNELELELEKVQTKTRELEKELEQARQASGEARQISSKIDTAAKSLFVTSLVDNDLERRLSQCCSKLQSVATQLDSMTSSSQQYRGSFDHTVQHQGLLVDVMSELRLLKGEITGTAGPQQKAEDVESSSEQVSRLLEHNQQLANHIVRLKQEKQHIASSLQLMETKLQKSKHAQVNLPQYASDTASEDGVVYDRTLWASERLGLQMALNSAEHEIERLRTEIQQFRSLVHSDRDIARFDPNKTDRLYGKYLRAESFRKALIYQKKYLLLLLGGYRDTEQETLAILASMGGFPTPYASNLLRSGSRAFTMFRSAGRVIIAISRMKYMVKKWKRATRVGSPVMAGQIPPHHAYVPTTSSFPTHPRHHHHHSKPSSSTHHRNTDVPSVPNGDTYTTTTLRSPHSYTTPPTKDLGRQYIPKSLPREGRQTSRRAILQNEDYGNSSHPTNGNYHPTQNGDILEYLESVHQHLTEGEYGAGRELL